MSRASLGRVASALLLAACGSGEAAITEPVAPEPIAAAPAPMGPAEVARAYLEAGARADEARVRALLDPQRHSEAGLLRVDAVRMLGAPVTLTHTTVTASDVTMTSANVAYTVEGSVHAEHGSTVLSGATVETGRVDMEGVTQSGTLQLAARDGAWHVVCPLYVITPYG